LADEDAEVLMAAGVSLFFDTDSILIRPDHDNLALAFEADETLQTLVSKKQIKFLQATNQRILQAIKQRGECWRISPLPQSPQEITAMILNAKAAIGGEAIYYHNRYTGTRLLTCDSFRGLGQLSPESLARHLEEIREFAARKNRLDHPEITFFQAESFGVEAFAGHDLSQLDAAELQRMFEHLAVQFTAAVPTELRHDNLADEKWRKAMFTALIGQRDETVADEILEGLSSEFFLQLEWLPGVRIEGGELLCDSIFDEWQQAPQRLAHLCDPKVKRFIFNAVREFGELEYLNVARIASPLSRRTGFNGRRGVYLAEIKPRQAPQAVVHVIRMQKWDVDYHLDKGKQMLDAILEAAEYTDYVLDRRLACRQLGMNLLARMQMHRLAESYEGDNSQYRGRVIWRTYFERDYCPGIATNKISQAKLENPDYAAKLGRLLGKAAAPNLIVGRQDLDYRVLFDDGDEIVREEDGLPVEIVVADATGSFSDFTNALDNFAGAYARPVISRWSVLKNPEEFAEAYLAAFVAEFQSIQQEYRRRRRAFDSLFQDRKLDPHGSMAFRWLRVLERLDHTDPGSLADHIRAKIGPA
jgi:hypothetical protein